TSRIEVRLSGDAAGLDEWALLAHGYRVPLVAVGEESERSRLFGVRFRTFVPARGLHPSVPGQGRVDLHLMHRRRGVAARVSIHGWRPDGAAYAGLPADAAEAARRRAERFVVERVPLAEVPPALEPRPAALSPFCLDLRRA
ncbi:MAG TPA: transglutaminase family protein, partial [Polyangiaceae bacterium]|nr:transglutaminase family protein [Polyangiaceae bacterium]